MQKRTYWQNRFSILENNLHNKGAEYVGRLDEQYRKASKQVQDEISKWYGRLAVNNEVTMADARKLLNAKELEEFKWTVEEYIKKGQISKGFEKQLENASAKFHISRLEALQLQMQEHVETLYYGENNDLTNALKKMYTEGYYQTAFELQKGFGIGFDLMKLDMDKVEKIISRPWASDGASFSDRIWKSKAELLSKLNTDLTQSIILGKNPSTLIDGVAKKFDVSRYQAGRLVYTETAFVTSASERDSFKELGVEEYEILATLDAKTSDICQGMDGEHFPLSQYEIGVTAPPFHPNCRTTTMPYFNDEFTLDETRAYRDANGKGTVPASMKYPEWKEKYINNKGFTSKAEDNIIKFTTRTEALEYLANKSIAFNDGRKYPMSEEALVERVNFIRQFEADYSAFADNNPVKLNSINNVPPSKIKNGVGGYYCYYPNSDRNLGITLNGTWNKNVVEKAIARGSFAQSDNTEVYTFAHEYGHYISHSLDRLLKHQNGDFERNLIKDCIKELGDSNIKSFAQLKGELSTYGTMSYSETFAEAFAEAYTSNKPRKFASIFKRKLDEALKGVK